MKAKHKIYSKDLGINLESKKESEYFKWFLACLLFGKPIQQEVAKKTYFEFMKQDLDTPDKILTARRDKLTKVLDEGHYVRYDFLTADKLLEVSKELKEKYGSLSKLFERSQNVNDLRRILQEFKGIGPKTTEIFLRDLGPLLFP